MNKIAKIIKRWLGIDSLSNRIQLANSRITRDTKQVNNHIRQNDSILVDYVHRYKELNRRVSQLETNNLDLTLFKRDIIEEVERMLKNHHHDSRYIKKD